MVHKFLYLNAMKIFFRDISESFLKCTLCRTGQACKLELVLTGIYISQLSFKTDLQFHIQSFHCPVVAVSVMQCDAHSLAWQERGPELY